MTTDLLPIQEQIWREKYRFEPVARVGGLIADDTIEDTWRRVASALAAPEGPDHKMWTKRFYGVLEDFQFLPAGRVLAGAGTGRSVTLFNCFVLGTVPDSMEGIFQRLKEGALTMQQGGGIGTDFSTIRPKGDLVKGVGADASGPLSFMDCWDAMCRTVMSAGARRGAMMGTLRCDHPDIEAFIEAKHDPRRFRNFNLSVLVTDDFMTAVEKHDKFALKFNGKIYRYVDARTLWNKITRNAYDFAEPGVIFIDRINTYNNLRYCETICATNPCAEQPLPPNGACLLGSINLTAFVRNPFEPQVYWDAGRAIEVVRLAVRMLDNVIDISNYPIPEQQTEAKDKRRIGLGITGLADALAMCGLHYGEDIARNTAAGWMKCITHEAYRASVDLAAEKGPFPLMDPRHGFHQVEKNVTRQTIYDRDSKPIRNSHLISIAPTGTISLLAGNISSGVEPIYEWEYERKILQPDGTKRTEKVQDYAVQLYRKMYPGEGRTGLPAAFFARHHELRPEDHLAMQAALQPHVDTSISKTVNCPKEMPFSDFQHLYTNAFRMNLKCCAAFRPNDNTGSVLSAAPTKEPFEVKSYPSGGGPGLWDKFKAADPEAITKNDMALVHSGIPLTESVLLTEDGKKELLDLVHVASGQKMTHASEMKVGETYLAFSPNERNTGPMIRPNGTGHPDVNPPSPRQAELGGITYKLKWPPSPHAIYVTINDCGDTGAPFEIFINSKNLEHYAWTVALTRMISAIFRRGGDISFVVEELKAIFDPKGGAWIDGGYVPSLLAAIGGVIEKHIKAKTWREPSNLSPIPTNHPTSNMSKDLMAAMVQSIPRHLCPKCNSENVVYPKPLCLTCRDCGYSNCG